MRVITTHFTATNDVRPSEYNRRRNHGWLMEKVRSRNDANQPSLFLPSLSLDASFSYHHWVVLES
jgi:hypothetical protein